MNKSYNTSHVYSFIDEWARLKTEIKKFEIRCAAYKKRAQNLMNQQNTDMLYGSDFKVVKKRNHSTHITKSNIPQDLWDRYSQITSFDAFYVKRQ